MHDIRDPFESARSMFSSLPRSHARRIHASGASAERSAVNSAEHPEMQRYPPVFAQGKFMNEIWS